MRKEALRSFGAPRQCGSAGRIKQRMMTPEQRVREIREIKTILDELEAAAGNQVGEIACLRGLLVRLEHWSAKVQFMELRGDRLTQGEHLGEGADGEA